MNKKEELIKRIIPVNGQYFYLVAKYINRAKYFIDKVSMLLNKDCRKYYIIVERMDHMRGYDIDTVIMLDDWYNDKPRWFCDELNSFIRNRDLKTIEITDRIFDGVHEIKLNDK